MPVNSKFVEAGTAGNVAELKALLDQNADVNSTNEYGYTALMMAADYEHVAPMELLLSRKANVDLQTRDDGRTALHCACYQGRDAAVALLLEANADLSLRNKGGKTAPDLAKDRKREIRISLGGKEYKKNNWEACVRLIEEEADKARLPQLAAELLVVIDRYMGIRSKLLSTCVTEGMTLVVRLDRDIECEVLPFENPKVLALVAGGDVELDVAMISFKDQSVGNMTVEQVQNELGLDEDGKLTVTMGECAVPVAVATANLQYMRAAVERLEQCEQAIFAMMRSPQEDHAVFEAASDAALALGGMESTVATCKRLHEGGERLC